MSLFDTEMENEALRAMESNILTAEDEEIKFGEQLKAATELRDTIDAEESPEELQAKDTELGTICSKMLSAKTKLSDLVQKRTKLIKELKMKAASKQHASEKKEVKLDANLINSEPACVNTNTLFSDLYTPVGPAFGDDDNNLMTSQGRRKNSVTSRIAKPPKFREGQDICIFLDRFEQFVLLSHEAHNDNLDLRLLNLIEDDNMYRKMRFICTSLTSTQKSNVSNLITAVRESLFPATESRMLRASLNTLKQKIDESAEDFAMRIEKEASKAFSPLDYKLKEEASLTALITGLESVQIRQKLMESEVNSFEKATRMAVKLDHIFKSLNENDRAESAETDFNVLHLQQNNTHTRSTPSAATNHAAEQSQRRDTGRARDFRSVVCWNCNKSGHIARNCRSPRFQNSRPYESGPPQTYRRESRSSVSNITCYSCGVKGHYANQCPRRHRQYNPSSSSRVSADSPDSGFQSQTQGYFLDSADSNGAPTGSNNGNRDNQTPLNENAAGLFPVHPSRLK